MTNRELEEIRKTLEEAGVPFPESMNLKTIDGVKWLIRVRDSQKEIIDRYEEMTGKMLIHNKVGNILEVDLEEFENDGES